MRFSHDARSAAASISGMKIVLHLNEIDFLAFVIFPPCRALRRALNKIRHIFTSFYFTAKNDFCKRGLCP